MMDGKGRYYLSGRLRERSRSWRRQLQPQVGPYRRDSSIFHKIPGLVLVSFSKFAEQQQCGRCFLHINLFQGGGGSCKVIGSDSAVRQGSLLRKALYENHMV